MYASAIYNEMYLPKLHIYIFYTVYIFFVGIVFILWHFVLSLLLGGPWYMWYIIVMAIVIVFVIIYMVSMQYAETALQTKYNKRDEEIDMGATRKLNR